VQVRPPRSVKTDRAAQSLRVLQRTPRFAHRRAGSLTSRALSLARHTSRGFRPSGGQPEAVARQRKITQQEEADFLTSLFDEAGAQSRFSVPQQVGCPDGRVGQPGLLQGLTSGHLALDR